MGCIRTSARCLAAKLRLAQDIAALHLQGLLNFVMADAAANPTVRTWQDSVALLLADIALRSSATPAASLREAIGALHRGAGVKAVYDHGLGFQQLDELLGPLTMQDENRDAVAELAR